jgi:hypothetical protein
MQYFSFQPGTPESYVIEALMDVAIVYMQNLLCKYVLLDETSR